ncbi:hypothetical protein N7493_008757 [Penicillium malachiteum]|uniref:Pre-mRNA-splicing factor 38B n=1 Tax=Penicillium malachiteum TaxID=1324776 RepID=A0AAD6HF73_9EURO|nr:hypothetical protein N7493_008757 [Penicillium malachiteum]
MDDDYVARVLAKEARDSSQKYSTEGLGAYMPKRPAGNAPKPNTRFLRHLIKETDSHNTALKRKEEREARERMRAMKDQSKADSASISHSSRRPDRSSTTRDSEQQRKQYREDRHRSHRRRDRSRTRTPSTDRERSRRHRHRDEKDRHRTTDDREEHTERRRDRRRHESSRQDRRYRERSYSRSRSRSPHRERDRGRAHRSHRSERSRRSETPPARSSHSRTKRESELHSRWEEHTSSRQSRLSLREPTKTSSSATLRNDESDESDPLEDLVGPLPMTDHSTAPVRSRGRGAYRPSTSNIDAHFAPDYDPTLDVQPDEEDDGYGTKSSSRRHVPGLTTGEDDWDMALEALRDRARWKQKGEDRLRAAGINEDAINRWKTDAVSTNHNDERRPEDVKWSTKDEGREWDRGKFVNDDGQIDVRAAWSK